MEMRRRYNQSSFLEVFLNPYFLILVALVALVAWSVGGYFFWRISQRAKLLRAGESVPPALRLADQWIAESQAKLEKLIESAEQPLSLAQHELLDLRLEAGRLPQGVKSLKLVRESIGGLLQPALLNKSLVELVQLHLGEGAVRVEGKDLVYLKSPMGEMPCLEIAGSSGLSDIQLKEAMVRLAKAAPEGKGNETAGGFLYFGKEEAYRACLAKPDWTEALRSRRLMALDFKALTVLLLSLKLSTGVSRLVTTFEAGVKTTASLVGQADKMGEALTSLSADSLRARTALDGGIPSEVKP
jgi:hypothetical protein